MAELAAPSPPARSANGKIKRLEYEIKPGDLGLTPQPIRVQTTGGRTVELPALRLGAAAVLVEETGVYLAAELSTAAPPALNSGAPSRSYAEYRAAFWAAAAPVGATGLPKQAGLYLSQELITRVLSPGFEPVKLEALQQRALYDVLDAVGAVGEVAAGAVISADTLCSRISKPCSQRGRKRRISSSVSRRSALASRCCWLTFLYKV